MAADKPIRFRCGVLYGASHRDDRAPAQPGRSTCTASPERTSGPLCSTLMPWRSVGTVSLAPVRPLVLDSLIENSDHDNRGASHAYLPAVVLRHHGGPLHSALEASQVLGGQDRDLIGFLTQKPAQCSGAAHHFEPLAHLDDEPPGPCQIAVPTHCNGDVPSILVGAYDEVEGNSNIDTLLHLAGPAVPNRRAADPPVGHAAFDVGKEAPLPCIRLRPLSLVQDPGPETHVGDLTASRNGAHQSRNLEAAIARQATRAPVEVGAVNIDANSDAGGSRITRRFGGRHRVLDSGCCGPRVKTSHSCRVRRVPLLLKRNNRVTMDLHAFPWWRFDQYTIRDGYVAPVREGQAPSGFDLWREDPDAEKRPARNPAYVDLANVADPDRENEITPPTPVEAERIIEWSGRYGATGVLLQRTAQVALPQGTLHRWGGNGWLAQTSGSRPHVMLRKLDSTIGWDDTLSHETLTQTWWRFFPSLWRDLYRWDPHLFVSQEPLGREAAAMLDREWPEPGRPEFRASYRECVPDFMAAALAFRTALQSARWGVEPDRSIEERIRAFGPLNHLQAPARQSLSLSTDGRRVSLRWSAPSALAALAIMAANDLSAGHDLRLCERASCRRIFRAGRANTRFCSRPCANAEKQRAYRQRASQV